MTRFERPRGDTVGGKTIAELGNEGELRWCENCNRWELCFFATDHVSFDVPVDAFTRLEFVAHATR